MEVAPPPFISTKEGKLEYLAMQRQMISLVGEEKLEDALTLGIRLRELDPTNLPVTHTVALLVRTHA